MAPLQAPWGFGRDRFPHAGTACADHDVTASLHPGELDRSTRRVLTEGGDARIAIDTRGINAYGCRPQPDPRLVALGSSTASVVSGAGFEAAAALHARLFREPRRYGSEVERVRGHVAALSGARRAAGTDVVLAASGTDILLIARQLAEDADALPVIAVMAEAAETGSGVPAALAGRHFAADTCSGNAVDKGTPAIAGAAQAPVCVPLRNLDGTVRSVEEIDAEFSYHVERIVRAGGRCLMVLTDVSKTGLIAPSPACARRLATRHPKVLRVLVDACQFRLAPSSVEAYLEDDFMVAVTGSKFVTGPTFCGALLVPSAVARRARRVCLDALRPYSVRSHWPPAWRAAHALPDAPNIGLLLRWEAASAELAAFAALPEGYARRFLATWGRAVEARIEDDPGLEALPVTALEPHRRGVNWDGYRSIFPFLIVDPSRAGLARYIDRTGTVSLHRQLQGLDGRPRCDGANGEANDQPRFQLGQPVTCGQRGDVDVSALRVCASARGIVEAFHRHDGIAHAIDAAMRAFDRLSVLVSESRSDSL